MDIAPCVLPCPQTQKHQSYCVESKGYSKMDISLWDAVIHYGVQLVQIVIQPDLETLLYGYSTHVYSLALRLRDTKVPMWINYSIGYLKTDISHWDAVIHSSACPILWSNPILKRYFMDIVPCALACPKTQEHQSTGMDSWVHRVLCGPMWTHDSIGNLKTDISHWDAVIHSSACPILWSNPILKRCFMDIVPCALACPKTQEHQSTGMDSWVHRVIENGHQPLGRGNALWR